MAFKEGVEAEHVSEFRSIKAKAASLDEAIDRGEITPYEAMTDLNKFIGAIDIPAPKKETKKEAASH